MAQGNVGKGMMGLERVRDPHSSKSSYVTSCYHMGMTTHGSKAIITITTSSYHLHVHQLDQRLQSHHPKATLSTNRLHLHNHHQPSLTKHYVLHHIIKVLMGQQRTIISNQGSNHCTVTTARVTIRKAPSNCWWHQGQSSIWCWHQ